MTQKAKLERKYDKMTIRSVQDMKELSDECERARKDMFYNGDDPAFEYYYLYVLAKLWDVLDPNLKSKYENDLITVTDQATVDYYQIERGIDLSWRLGVKVRSCNRSMEQAMNKLNRELGMHRTRSNRNIQR